MKNFCISRWLCPDRGCGLSAGGILFLMIFLLAQGPALAADAFSFIAPMNTPRWEHTATRLSDGTVLVAGGRNGSAVLESVEIYDAKTNSWTVASPLASARSGHVAITLTNGKVLLLGGRDGAGSALKVSSLYEPSTGTWSATGSMNTARQNHAACLLTNGTVVVTGGSADTEGLDSLSSTEIYNPSSGVWTLTGYLNAPRSFHSINLVSGEPTVIGGGSGSTYVTDIEVYNSQFGEWGIAGSGGGGDPSRRRKSHTATVLRDFRVLVAGGTTTAPLATAGTYKPYSWTVTGGMAASHSGHTATLLRNDKVLVVGGLNADGVSSVVCELYGGSGWSAAPSLATARTGHTATLLSSGGVLVAGGTDGNGVLASCETFSPNPAPWEDAAPMWYGRTGHSATLLPSGKVLVAAGSGWGQSFVSNTELFDPKTDSWKLLTPISGRAGQSTTLLPDGRVLFAGGYRSPSGAGFSAACDFFQSATNAWGAAASMNDRRAFHACVLLPDGKVLVAGGYKTNDYMAMASAEVFDPVTGLWSLTNPMTTPRNRPAGVLLTNGKALVIGTTSTYSSGPLSAELYDPASGSWSPAGTLNYPHESFSCVLLQDGQVLVAGGTYYENVRGTAEIYNPLTNSWNPAAQMLNRGLGQNAVLLPDGRVFFSGTDSFDTGNQGQGSYYNPANDSWTGTAAVRTGLHATTLLPDGRILFTGGELPPIDPAITRCRTWNSLAAVPSGDRPVISSAYVDGLGRVVLSGTGFTADAGIAPVVQWRRLDNGQTVNLSPDAASVWSATRFTSQPLNPLPQGHAIVTVFNNGIPGISTILSATAPEISLENAAGVDLVNGQGVHFGTMAPSAQSEIAFTIRNHGHSDLSGIGVTLTGPDRSRFSVSTAPPGLLNPSAASAFMIRFTPESPGPKTALLKVASNDADESPFELILTGLATNSSPVISGIEDQSIDEDGTAGPLAFTVDDAETLDSLTVLASSSNSALLPVSGIFLGGGAMARTVTLIPTAGSHGIALTTLTVSDGVFQTLTTFQLTVNAVNDPPTLAGIPDPAVLPEDAGGQTIALTEIDSGEGAAQPVTLSVSSDNAGLFELLNITGTTLHYRTAAGRSGKAVVSVTADDGQRLSNSKISRSFTLTVLPVIRGQAMSIPEGNAGLTPMIFRLFIGSPQAGEVSVDYVTDGITGGALAGTDYVHTSGKAMIPAGATEALVTVNIMGDTAFEADEVLGLRLTNPVGALYSAGPITGVILNDDAQPALSVTPGRVTEVAGGGPFRIWISAALSAPAATTITWNVRTRAGTAQEGTDFTPLGPVNLSFHPGETAKWVAVGVGGSGNQGAEGDEEFFIDFTAASGPASTVTSVCIIRQLTITDFFPLSTGLYAVVFPTGTGQSYVIEESPSPAGPWANNSSIILGSGDPVTQVIFSSKTKAFFRVSAAPAAPGAAAVGP